MVTETFFTAPDGHVRTAHTPAECVQLRAAGYVESDTDPRLAPVKSAKSKDEMDDDTKGDK